MKTYFHERTAYRLSNDPVPNCFFKLDEYFDTVFESAQQAYQHQSLLLAEQTCGRMADVEMYAFLLDDAQRRHSREEFSTNSAPDVEPFLRHSDPETDKGSVLVRSFMYGYLAACKALLDSAALTLSELYQLPLHQADQRFENPEFWHELVIAAPNVHRRYHAKRTFFYEVTRWRDEAVNRIPPVALLHGHLTNRDLQLKVINEKSDNLPHITESPTNIEWIEPLTLHSNWKPNLLDLCERICVDIEKQTQVSPI